MISLMQTSVFVTVKPSLFDARALGLDVVPVPERGIIREFQIVHRSDADLSPVARKMIRLIHAHFEPAGRLTQSPCEQ
ncbi:hypothetical protein SAMN03159494_03006 [Achromobacter sp. NFACC18-2]|nr:hypothetical protein SAMN03159494_03006 [Achromobacter sp. NFACC18-2]